VSDYRCEVCGADVSRTCLRFCIPCLDSGAADRWLDEHEPLPWRTRNPKDPGATTSDDDTSRRAGTQT
jgi:hypothetical protein